MRLPDHRQAHLAYCLNVHPAETWAESFEAIRTHAVAVKAAVFARGGPPAALCGAAPFGLGLRLSRTASSELAAPAALDALKSFLAGQGLYAFTVNAFPFGRFHGAPVKESVYRPDWRTPERTQYTVDVARILAALLPDGVGGSLSTLPGSYAAWVRTPADRALIAENLARVAVELDALRGSAGRELCLGLEPEPDCLLETTPQTVRFLEEELLGAGASWLRREGGRSAPEAEALLRRHVGVCLDTCHAALQFEDPAASLRAVAGAGFRVCKVQISAALRADGDAAALRGLTPFDDAVYLHQTRIRGGGSTTAFPDLGPALAAIDRVPRDLVSRGREIGAERRAFPPQSPAPAARGGRGPSVNADCCREWRVHCHVPLYYEGAGGVASTAADLTPAFFAEALRLGVTHFEIETYTFDVLPPALRARGVVESVAREYRWVLDRMA